MKRRKFIKKCGAVGLSCMAGQSILTSCSAVVYAPHTVVNNQIIVKKFDFPSDTNYVLVKDDRLPAPIYLCKLTGENYVALLMECTHKKCEVQPFADQLHCPCHGSEFTNTGKVLEGPAEVDLKKFQVTTDTVNIFIS